MTALWWAELALMPLLDVSCVWVIMRLRRRIREFAELRHRLETPELTDAMLGQLAELAAVARRCDGGTQLEGQLVADWLRMSSCMPSDLAIATVLARLSKHAEIVDDASGDPRRAWDRFRSVLAVAAANLSALERDLAPRA